MYIISKHRDYYDTALGAGGIDKTLVYERKVEDFEYPVFLKDYYLPHRMRTNSSYSFSEAIEHWRGTKKDPNYRFIIIGFCGKTYVGLQLAWEEKKKNEINPVKKTEIIYNKDEILKFLKKKTSKINGKKNGYWYGGITDSTIANINSFFDKYDGKENFLDEIFRKRKAPYFVMEVKGKNRWARKKEFVKGQLNPVLKDLEFYKIFDPYQAFQEVSMFIGGVLGVGEKDTIEISDEHKRASRGFTDMSFKRREHQAKPRRNKKKKK